MMLDRKRLAGYVGNDAAFELEFLKLLRDTVVNCLSALSQPTPQIYKTLHAAKAGLVVAASDVVQTSINNACDLTVDLPSHGLTPDAQVALAELEAVLARLHEEIGSVLAASQADKH